MGIFDALFGKKPSQPAPPQSEQYLFALEPGITNKEAASGFASLSPAEQVFFCVWSLEAEVNNGGFSQFYYNSAGDVACETPAALRAIGAAHTASLVEKANAVFGPAGPPADREERMRLVSAFDLETQQELDQLDMAFYEYRDNLSALLEAYMKERGA